MEDRAIYVNTSHGMYVDKSIFMIYTRESYVRAFVRAEGEELLEDRAKELKEWETQYKAFIAEQVCVCECVCAYTCVCQKICTDAYGLRSRSLSRCACVGVCVRVHVCM